MNADTRIYEILKCYDDVNDLITAEPVAAPKLFMSEIAKAMAHISSYCMFKRYPSTVEGCYISGGTPGTDLTQLANVGANQLSFYIMPNSTVQKLITIDYTGLNTGSLIATALQTAIRAATTVTDLYHWDYQSVTVTYDVGEYTSDNVYYRSDGEPHYLITSGTTGAKSRIRMSGFTSIMKYLKLDEDCGASWIDGCTYEPELDILAAAYVHRNYMNNGQGTPTSETIGNYSYSMGGSKRMNEFTDAEISVLNRFRKLPSYN